MSNVIEIKELNVSDKFTTDIHNLINNLPDDTQMAHIIGLLEIVKFDLLHSLPIK